MVVVVVCVCGGGGGGGERVSCLFLNARHAHDRNVNEDGASKRLFAAKR